MAFLKANLQLASFLQTILEEDLDEAGDVTSLATIPEDAVGNAEIIAKQNGVIAGNWVADTVFKHIDPNLNYIFQVEDGAEVKPGDIIAKIDGSIRSILTAERSALNLLGRMSGVATMTRHFVEKIKHTRTKILDTRKTTPGLRFLEKYAVTVGGGFNHRFGLSDMVLIKENHIKAAGGVRESILRCREYMQANNLDLKIEIETTNREEVQLALEVGVDRIMLDNMTPDKAGEIVALVNRQVELEISGGMTLENILSYAELGVDYISVGGLTHSVPALDISLLLR